MEDETDAVSGDQGTADLEDELVAGSDYDENERETRTATWGDLIQSADLAFLVGGTWHRIAARLTNLLHEQGFDHNDPLLVPLRRSLNFFLDAHLHGRTDVDLVPKGLHDGRKWSIKGVPASDVEVWSKIADEVEHPAARAHFHDLLFKRGGKDAPRHASTALSYYMEVARIDHYNVPVGEEDEERQFQWNGHSRNVAMGRALSLRHVIAKTPEFSHLIEDSQSLALRRLREVLEDPSPHIGDLLLLIRLLTRSRRTLTTSQADVLKDLIETAISRHRDRDDVVDGLVGQLILLVPGRARELNRLRVQVRLEIAAAHSQAQVRMIHLERAASLARDHNLRDLHDEAIREMQRVSREDLGFQTFSTETALQMEVIAAEIVRSSEGASWQDALTSWLKTGSPAGSAKANREGAENLASKALVSQLGMPTVVYGRDGLPRWTAASEEDRRDHELARHEMFAIQFNGLILAEGLETISRSHGVPDVTELTLHLAHNGDGDFDLAGALARALHRFWAGDYEGALMTSALRVEAGARHLAVALDEAAYVTSRQSAPGVYVGIAALTDLLEKHGLDEDWKRFLLTYFVSPVGRNLRHDLAHGFGLEESAPRIEAALSLRALGLFVYASWQPGKDSVPPTPMVGSHATGLVDAAGLLFRRVQQGVPIRALLRHEVVSFARLVRGCRRWRKERNPARPGQNGEL
ncbi:hypothetical protein IDH50_03210 [Aeromicrobium tamlense]|uniref:DUF4209 domain-containing protein n=1 Tax=Aeromicrobium tamlense TaxID=375541 RepID=A0A8I0FTJ9_9ACTN|nr:hypothetical protein [Aeromicrobium tamlense]MBD1269233.1 hypothetical protein [Aeromicrobium tamlense]NYI36859.1 hypothetical protein [Aeromicrobium tamlense]